MNKKTNLEKEITFLIKKYTQEINRLEEEYEEMEYSPAPSGEVNESMIPMDLCSIEISTMQNVVDELKDVLEKYDEDE